ERPRDTIAGFRRGQIRWEWSAHDLLEREALLRLYTSTQNSEQNQKWNCYERTLHLLLLRWRKIRTKSVSVAGLLRGDGLNRDPRPFERSANLHDAFRPRRFRFGGRNAVERQVRFPAKADASLETDLFLRRTQLQIVDLDATRAHVEYAVTVGPAADTHVRRAGRETCRHIPTAKF